MTCLLIQFWGGWERFIDLVMDSLKLMLDSRTLLMTDSLTLMMDGFVKADGGLWTPMMDLLSLDRMRRRRDRKDRVREENVTCVTVFLSLPVIVVSI